MAEEVVKPNRGFAGAATRWFGLLGVLAAATALVLVPVVLDPDLLGTNPTRAYFQLELRVFLVASVALLIAVLGVLILGGRPVGVPVLLPVLAFLGVSSLSALLSDRPIHSLYGDRGEGLLSLAAGALLFYALSRGLATSSRVRLFLAAAVTTAGLVSVYGIAQNYGLSPISGWGNPPFTDLGRSFATIGNPLSLAAYLTLLMGAAVALWLVAASRAWRVVWLLVLALIGACWIYAESRGALLGAGVALPAVLFAARRRMGTVRPLVVPIAVLVAAMAVAVVASKAFGFSTLSVRVCAVLLVYLAFVGAFFWLLERGRARLALLFVLVVLLGAGVTAFAAASSGKLIPTDLGRARSGVSKDGDVSLQTRLHIWRDTVPMILDRPLLGYGPDNYGKPFLPYMSEELKKLVSPGKDRVRVLDRAHNHLLQVAATTGLLGLAAYLWILLSYFRNAYRRGGWALMALSGGMLAYVLQILTSFPSVATDVAFWGILGTSVALMRLHDGEGGETPYEATTPLPSEAPGEGHDKLSVAGDAVGSRRSKRLNRRRSGLVELLVAVAVMGILTTIAVPTFLQQREKAANSEQLRLNIDVRRTVQVYEQTQRSTGTYPEAGVYTRERPIMNPDGRPKLRPSRGVTITTKTTPGGDFAVEAESTTLAGTFRYAYDSTTGRYSASPDPNT